MKSLLFLGVSVSVLLAVAVYVLADAQSGAFSPYVDESGAISLPKDFRTEWTFLGTWSIASDEREASVAAMGHGSGAAGFHNVYTQPETVEAFRQTGKFPDGAVLVKELLKGETASLTTGTASWGHEVEGWFVMIKDSTGRFDGHPLWGLGWGWALFDSKDPTKPVTTNFRTECVGCHIPAKDSDWIYVYGYPVLQN